MEKQEKRFKEQRVRKITNLYYSRQDVQNAIFQFSKNREISPQYFEGFGKRPDTFQYKNDILELAKKGATSFHCSEELWSDPLKIQTGMNEKQANELRTGWDLLIDIDSPYIDYSKISAEVIIEMFKFHSIKNIGIKFSGSKGFHILIPWKAFPKKINNQKTSEMFPEWPRIISKYIMEKTKPEVAKKISKLIYKNSKYEFASNYIRGEKREKEVLAEVSPDIILVSPRHLFRMPYSLHEKTALASIVLNLEELKNFQLKDADALQAKVKNFMPDSEEGEASELLMQALDWNKENNKKSKEVNKEFKKIKLSNLSDKTFPPCILNILKGISDGKKRALFALINLFRSTGMEKDELEKRISDWNKKNSPPIKEGYVKSQISWAYKNKIFLPPNCKEFYKGIGVCQPNDFCKTIKNPLNYVVKKDFLNNKKNKS